VANKSAKNIYLRMKMNKCWANSLGNCDRMSGEHILSNSVFSAGCSCPILVEGVNRIRAGQPTRGAEKSNILCGHHNSILSPLDEEIGKVARFQADANDENFNEPLYIQGELLERWLLKTVINAAVAGWLGQAKLFPSKDMVSSIFGFSKVPEGLGLYSVDGIDPNHRPSGGAGITPIIFNIGRQQILAGAYVTVHGMPLFVSLNQELASALEAGSIPMFMTKFSENGLTHLYHPGAIVIYRKRGEPAIIGISWNGVLRFADGTTAVWPREKLKNP
jgi:hypothetical protein